MSVASAERDQGPPVTSALPPALAHGSNDGPHADDTSDGRALNGVIVAVIDDDRDARDLLDIILSASGAHVTQFGSADAAMRGLPDLEPDLLLVDISMPVKDGYALMRELRDQGVETPAVAVTAFAGEDHRKRALKSGFNEHVAKPVDLPALVRLCAALTRG
jgi:CheY-like chemotaxis protein